MTEKYPGLRSVCDRWIEDAVETKMSEVPSTVYHYTDAAGLFGMIKNGSVWATDFRFLNDKTEMVHLAGIVSAYILEDNVKKDDTDISINRSFVHYMGIDSPFDQYVFSLSSEKDDLSQWRGYAREGKGFTLGLSGPELFSASQNTGNNFAFLKVEYDHRKQLSLIKNVIRDMKKEVVLELAKHDSDPEDIYDDAGRFFRCGNVGTCRGKQTSLVRF